MAWEAAYALEERAARSIDDPVKSEITIGPLAEPKPSKYVVSDLLLSEPKVQALQQEVQLSSESEFAIPKSIAQQIPITISQLMDLDDSRGSFDLAIAKEQMAKVSRVMEPW